MDSKARRPKRPRKKVVLIPKFNPDFGDLYLMALENFSQIIRMKQAINKPGAVGPTSGKIEHIKFLSSFEIFWFQVETLCAVCGRDSALYFGRLDQKKLYACCQSFKHYGDQSTVEAIKLYPLSLGVFKEKEFSSPPARKELSDFFKDTFSLKTSEEIYDFLVSQCSAKQR